MSTDDRGGEGDRELMDALFTPDGRRDPQAAARAHPTLGCRHAVVDARLHGTIGLRVLFDRFPNLVVLDGPRWRSGAPVRQLDSLHVRW